MWPSGRRRTDFQSKSLPYTPERTRCEDSRGWSWWSPADENDNYINIRLWLLGSQVSRKTFIFNDLFCALIGRSPLNRKHSHLLCAVPLTTDFRVLWTAKILFPMENLMHFTSPLSSILRRNHHHHHDAVSNWNSDYLSTIKQSVFSLRGCVSVWIFLQGHGTWRQHCSCHPGLWPRPPWLHLNAPQTPADTQQEVTKMKETKKSPVMTLKV